MSSDLLEFQNLSFSIEGQPNRAPKIKEINWLPPPCNQIKCNTHGAAKGAPDPVACGGIFRDYRAAILGCFSANIGNNYDLQAELLGAMLANEIAFKKGWNNLWLECDSLLVIKTFNSSNLVPWKLRNK